MMIRMRVEGVYKGGKSGINEDTFTNRGLSATLEMQNKSQGDVKSVLQGTHNEFRGRLNTGVYYKNV